MRPKNTITFIIGLLLVLLGVYMFIKSAGAGGIIPFLFGVTLAYLGFTRSQAGTIIFGHASIIVGCCLVAWGLYLLPHAQPTFAGIVLFPLFWGLFAIFGGICANVHGFCTCAGRMKTKGGMFGYVKDSASDNNLKAPI